MVDSVKIRDVREVLEEQVRDLLAVEAEMKKSGVAELRVSNFKTALRGIDYVARFVGSARRDFGMRKASR